MSAFFELLAAAAFFLLLAGCWYPCGGCHCACDKCLNGRAPKRWKVVLSGIVTDSGCANCPDWNATWFIDVPCDSGCGAYLFHDLDCAAAPSFDDGVYVTVAQVAGDYIVTVELRWTTLAGVTQKNLYFGKNYGEQKPDCLNFEDESIPYGSPFVDGCDGTAATCLLTAVE